MTVTVEDTMNGLLHQAGGETCHGSQRGDRLPKVFVIKILTNRLVNLRVKVTVMSFIFRGVARPLMRVSQKSHREREQLPPGATICFLALNRYVGCEAKPH